MVQLMNSGTIWPDSDTDCRKKFPVKLEVEDSLEEEHGPLNKRSKLDSSQLQWSSGTSAFPIPPSQYNPLDEPSPLGLRLRKSPSLLDLIQMRLSQGNTAKLGTQGKKDHKGTAVSGSTDKLKASNFPASVLRIGKWVYASKYEGDLVAKCYFAKHKLVWEVLDGGLKSKIEIQWSDIVALKGNYPDNEPGTLDIVLARQPLFFRETNPQPRKHTLWQATTDFTSGQASMYRRHFLQCPQGMLGKHFEKLIQCDPRLNFLSQQPEIALESPYFEPRGSLFDDPSESNIGFGLKSEGEPTLFGMRDPALASGAQPSSSKNEQQDPVGRPSEQFSRETPSPSSVMDTHAIEEIGSHGTEELKGLSQSDQIKVPGLHPSMSMSDLVNHIEHRISEQISSGNPIKLENRYILDEITQSLFSDSQLLSASDEQSIMSRVNSLCCLLQKDAVTVQNLQFRIDNGLDIPSDERIDEPNSISVSSCGSKVGVDFSAPEGESNDVSGCKQAPAMSRKDSVGELLLNLPRIASLPRFLFNISDDFNNQAR